MFKFQVPDVGAELTGGCYGFATRYNHWPEQLVVGGTEKNASGHIVRYVSFFLFKKVTPFLFRETGCGQARFFWSFVDVIDALQTPHFSSP